MKYFVFTNIYVYIYVYIIHYLQMTTYFFISISRRYVIIQQKDIFAMLTFCEVLIRYKKGMTYLHIELF